jgi:isopentenyldiphosphate isomerase
MPEEMIDLLSPDGTPLGRVKEKSLVHRDGDWHRTAHLWIVTPDRRVLLQKRAASKVNHPSLWDVSVAGHVDAGESPETAAVREAREELGIEIAEGELRQIGTIHEQWVIDERSYIDNEIQSVFLVRRSVEPTRLVLQPGEVDDVELLSVSELRTAVSSRAARLVPHWPEYELLLAELE